jgi:hypothetical protein
MPFENSATRPSASSLRPTRSTGAPRVSRKRCSLSVLSHWVCSSCPAPLGSFCVEHGPLIREHPSEPCVRTAERLRPLGNT